MAQQQQQSQHPQPQPQQQQQQQATVHYSTSTSPVQPSHAMNHTPAPGGVPLQQHPSQHQPPQPLQQQQPIVQQQPPPPPPPVSGGFTQEELAVRAEIRQRLDESSDRDRLKQLLHAALLETGWQAHMTQFLQDFIKSKGGDKVTMESLIQAALTQNREWVPAAVQQQLLQDFIAIIDEADLR